MARQMVTGCVQKNIPILPLYLGSSAGARASRDVMFISAWNCTSSVLLIWAMREPQCVGRLAGKFSTLFCMLQLTNNRESDNFVLEGKQVQQYAVLTVLN